LAGCDIAGTADAAIAVMSMQIVYRNELTDAMHDIGRPFADKANSATPLLSNDNALLVQGKLWMHMLPVQIMNRDEIVDAMHDIGRTFGLAAQPYTLIARANFESYPSVMAGTGVLVSCHAHLHGIAEW